MGAIIGAALIGVAGTAASMAMQPGSPDYGKATTEGILADINTLPLRRSIEAAAHKGGKVEVPVPGGGSPIYSNVVVTPSAGPAKGGNPTYVDSKGNVYQGGMVTKDADGNYFVKKQIGSQPTTQTFDFSGLGDADLQISNANKLAPALLALSKKYGWGFIKQRLAELKLANPQEWAAKEKMFNEIMASVDKKPDTRMAQTLSDQIMSDLAQGGKLDADTQREVEQDVLRSQAARGNMIGNAPMFEEAQSIGREAEARKSSRQQKALQFLTSGATPDDVDFRRFQQNLGNLGSFVAGTKPSAEFSTLSGAQNGPVPFVGGEPMQTNINPNAAANGVNFAVGQYNTQSQAPNPWMRGLSTGLNAYGMLQSRTTTPKPNPAANNWGYGADLNA
jgi:hypothetical protein